MALEFDKEQEQEQQVQYGNQLEQEEPEKPKVPELDGNDDDIEVPDEDQQMALFDTGESKEKEKKKPASKKAAAKPKKEEKVNTEFIVYYAGNRIPVPQDDMTIEQVRSFLESEFPELSKERTEMTLNKDKKEIVPVVKGAKKG